MSKAIDFDVFISHIHEEKGIALVLQRFIEKAMGPGCRTFVSSDPVSIGGGRKWFEHIIESVKRAKVVLLLISDESRSREWINFEAGCGEGAGALVIPVAIRGSSLGKLEFPLKGYNGRSADDIEGIMYDIGQRCGVVTAPVDRLEYSTALHGAEDAVTYKSVILRPYLVSDGEAVSLLFEIRNQGNTDIELLHVDVYLPTELRDRSWTPGPLGPRGVGKEEIDGQAYFRIRLTALLNALDGLEPVLTRSMGWVQLPSLRCALDASKPGINTSLVPIFYQVHARNFDTEKERTCLRDVPYGPSR